MSAIDQTSIHPLHQRSPGRLVVVGLGMGLAIAPGWGWAGNGIWQSSGPRGPAARVGVAAVDPTDPQVVYGVTVNNTVHKSVDGGLTWHPASLGLPANFGGAMAVDPTNPLTVYILGDRVFRSLDGGGSWAQVSLNLPTGYGARRIRVLIDPRQPTTLYAGFDPGGLFKSTDGGTNWSPVSAGTFGSVTAMAFDPQASSTLYVSNGAGIFKSTDAGSSWTMISTVTFTHAIVVDPVSPSRIYATAYPGFVIRTTDGGFSWTTLKDNVVPHDISSLAIDSVNPATVYLGTLDAGVFKSTAYGEDWQPANQGLPKDVSITAARGVIYANTGSGLHKSTDSAVSWVKVPGPEVLNVSMLASRNSTVFAGTDVGVFRSTDSGATWGSSNAGLTVPYVRSLAFDPLAPTTVYLGTEGLGGGIFKSTDSGDSWTLVETGGFSAIVVAPAHPSTIYAGGTEGLSKSTDAGANWSLTSLAPGVADLVIDPLTTSRLYALVDGALFKSNDAGANWAAASPGLGSSVYAYALVIDPVAPTTLYAAAYSGLFKSTDGGSTWNASVGLPNAPVFGVAVDSTAPSTVYAAPSGYGVYKSTDAGASWAEFNRGLTGGQVSRLAFEPSGRTTLYAALGDTGVWQIHGTTGAFHTVAPCRAVDTRTTDAPSLGAGENRSFILSGKCGIPPGASSVSMNLTVTGATSPGHLRLSPGRAPLPPNSAVNFAPGQTRANSAVSLLGPSGDLAIFSGQAQGGVHVIVDVNGYFE